MIKFWGASDLEYGWMSNFYPCIVLYNGIEYLDTEAAWQAQKTLDINKRKEFSLLRQNEAKKKGRSVELRPDWEEVKYGLMVDVLRAKFTQHEDLKQKLLDTVNEEIIENTTGWHDNIWGECLCNKCINIKKQNLLGKALMDVRDELYNGN